MVRIGVEGLALKPFQWKWSGKPKVVRSEMGQMRKNSSRLHSHKPKGFKKSLLVSALIRSRTKSQYLGRTGMFSLVDSKGVDNIGFRREFGPGGWGESSTQSDGKKLWKTLWFIEKCRKRRRRMREDWPWRLTSNFMWFTGVNNRWQRDN